MVSRAAGVTVPRLAPSASSASTSKGWPAPTAMVAPEGRSRSDVAGLGRTSSLAVSFASRPGTTATTVCGPALAGVHDDPAQEPSGSMSNAARSVGSPRGLPRASKPRIRYRTAAPMVPVAALGSNVPRASDPTVTCTTARPRTRRPGLVAVTVWSPGRSDAQVSRRQDPPSIAKTDPAVKSPA
jgi:hypothetical protein